MTLDLDSALATHILIVDDTPDNLRLLAKILESQGYVVRKSLNGRMALQAAQRDPPDLILLDINMPEMSGYEVCQQLKALEVTRSIPVIFISALDQVNDKVRAFEMGGQDYIAKPFQELEVLARIKNQLIIQQQKKQLLEQQQLLIQLNNHLEEQVIARTEELQQSLSFELALKRITDQVRDSLDQHQILQTAVETLAQSLSVQCCDAALYSADHATSTIRYQWVQPGLQATQGQTLYMADFPELYEQLQSRLCFAFCQIEPSFIRNHSAILACTIYDDQVNQTGILGDLWLFKEIESSFSEMEIHFVQQVANQCAIALRQAKLYEAAQAQVKELEKLNQLKDDFLSTISHELRTPIANMQMVIKLLITLTEQGHNLLETGLEIANQNRKLPDYLNVLQEECDRELALVEDLLNLQHIETGSYLSQPTAVNLQDFILHVLEPFESRTQNQQQILEIHIAPDLPVLHCDSFSLSRIITELLSNACKYTPLGEKIAIAVQMVPAQPVQWLQIQVSNTGVSIPAEELARIFDKFYRIPNHDPWKHGGTGLGLALVKKLITQIGGSITVTSDDQQTCFTVQLPVN